jgi:hypothetical protein
MASVGVTISGSRCTWFHGPEVPDSAHQALVMVDFLFFRKEAPGAVIPTVDGVTVVHWGYGLAVTRAAPA